MWEVRKIHMEKGRQIRSICTSSDELRLSLDISNANEGSELSFSICSLTEGTSEALLPRALLAINCGAPNPEYYASAECLVPL